RDGLAPANDLFAALAHPLAQAITQGLPASPGAASRLGLGRISPDRLIRHRHMRHRAMLLHLQQELPGLVAHVHARGARDQFVSLLEVREHAQRVASLGVAIGEVDRDIQAQAAAIVHHHVAAVAQMRLAAIALAGQPRIGIGRRSVRRIAAFLALPFYQLLISTAIMILVLILGLGFLVFLLSSLFAIGCGFWLVV